MKVYTKTGDKGTTDLIGGKRVSKNHYRLEAYGSIDELMAYTALLHDQLSDNKDKEFFLHIQDRLMTCASILATDSSIDEMKIPQIMPENIRTLELAIDEMDKNLPQLTFFIIPGGHTTISYCHIARTVCRRCERLALTVHEHESNCEMVIKYLNRLSDYFFVFGRKLNKELNVDEIPWVPSR